MSKYKNPQLLILVGPPGSGKSTFAKYHLRTEENWFRVNRDDLRLMQFSHENLSEDEEALLTKMVDSAIITLLNNKVNVVVDATHTRKEFLNQYIVKFNHLADISFKLFEVETEELKQRVIQRHQETEKFIPPNVLKRFIEQYESVKNTFDFSRRPKVRPENIIRTQDPSLPKAIICDLDGTLCLMDGRSPFDASKCDQDLPNLPVVNMVKNYHQLGYKIILASGREDTFKPQTIAWLDAHDIAYELLVMRAAGDFRKDAIVKREIFETHIEGKYFVELVLDDRNQVVDLWRNDLHLPCFQVYYGDF
ncbi:MAG TPA: AAA family ATPase [Saprospiraceae bacterium]|nr:AAA family ATPase [Saprospiraceae bacterium]HMU02560.1 AAA family ATPase [Saprospiraceae bacterium]